MCGLILSIAIDDSKKNKQNLVLKILKRYLFISKKNCQKLIVNQYLVITIFVISFSHHQPIPTSVSSANSLTIILVSLSIIIVNNQILNGQLIILIAQKYHLRRLG